MKYNVALKRFLLFSFKEGEPKGGVRDFASNFAVLKEVVIGFPFKEIEGGAKLYPRYGEFLWPKYPNEEYCYQLLDLRFFRITHYTKDEFIQFLKDIKAKYKV